MTETETHPSAALCANCGAPLTGPYCSQCGQHSHDSSRSLAVVLHDVWHVFVHVDGRLWLTLKTLLLRPGRLTLEYFAGRRARYIPPFQLYFVVSVVLFGLPTLISHVGAGASTSAAADSALAVTRARPADADFTVEDCSRITVRPPWLDHLMKNACRRQAADQGRSLMREFSAAIPRMMFLFLPLMAAVMLLLYLKQRRYYVEHLVYFLHLHAALFIAIVLSMLIGTLADAVPALRVLSETLGFVVFFYGAWYVYRSMRRFYGQSRRRTALKLIVVSFAYLTFLGITLLSTLVMTALFA